MSLPAPRKRAPIPQLIEFLEYFIQNDILSGMNHLIGGDDLMLKIEIEEEADGRFIAEVPDLPGVMAYGRSRKEAVEKVEALALRTLADRVEQGEPVPELPQIFSAA
jgi:predicted RNase H-like HicB family nuclease